MGLVKELLSEMGQAVAADLLFLGMLVSVSSAVLFVYGVGAHQAEMRKTALQQRYAAELVQGVLLSSRYVDEDCTKVPGGNYTLGLVKLEEDMFTDAGIPVEGGPLERRLCSNIFDLIAEDLVFNLNFREREEILVGGGYHEEAERLINERFERLAPGMMYQISAHYSSAPRSQAAGALYAEVNYTNTGYAPSGGVYAARLGIPMPCDPGSTAIVEIRAWFSAEGDWAS